MSFIFYVEDLYVSEDKIFFTNCVIFNKEGNCTCLLCKIMIDSVLHIGFNDRFNAEIDKTNCLKNAYTALIDKCRKNNT